VLQKREVIHLHGIPIGTVEVIISDGGMIFVSNLKVTASQANLGLVTDQMTFDSKPAEPQESTGGN
jgi:hypothetical protein